MIIDTHAQLNTREAVEKLPEHLIAGYTMLFSDIDNLGLEHNIKDMDEAGVDKSVIVAIDAETPHNYRVPNELVADAVKQYPDRLIGFASVDPHRDECADELDNAVKNLGLRGLKLVPNLIEMNADDRRIYPLYETARDLGIPVLFHTGTLFYTGIKLKYGQPLPIDDVAIDFPGLTIIMAHFGFPWFHEAMAIAQRNPNVYINLAGWKPKYIPKEVLAYVNGPLRYKALFGSDYPLLKRTEVLTEIDELNLKEETFRLLTEENPKRVLSFC